MRLYKKSCFFLLGFAKVFTGFDCLGKPGIEIFRLRNSHAIRASSTEVWKPVATNRAQTIHCLCKHEGQRVFAAPGRPSENYGLRKATPSQHLTQAIDHVGISVKIGERHKSG